MQELKKHREHNNNWEKTENNPQHRALEVLALFPGDFFRFVMVRELEFWQIIVVYVCAGIPPKK